MEAASPNWPVNNTGIAGIARSRMGAGNTTAVIKPKD
jgi:hypothetical protein